MIRIKRGRAPYWHQLLSFIEDGSLKYFREADVFAVEKPFEVKVRYFKRQDDKLVEVEDLIPFLPGIVVFRRKRVANQRETKEWRNLTPAELEKLCLERRNGKIFVYIAERIESLWHAARQSARHGVASYLGIKIKVNKKALILCGNVQRMNKVASELAKVQSTLTDLLSKAYLPEVKEVSQKILKRIAKILDFIKGIREKKAELRGKIKEALERKKIPEVTFSLAKAGMIALEQVSLDLKIVEALLKRAERRIQLDLQIQNLLKESYNSLGKLAKEVEEMIMEEKLKVERLKEIGEKGKEIYERIQQEVRFDPYLNEAVLTREFQGLSRLLKQIGKGPETVLNTLRLALKKIEKFAIGEVPTLEEIKRIKV